MWGGATYCRALFRQANCFFKIHKDRFMSAAFKCEGAWDMRLKSSLLQKVNLDQMIYEIDDKYNRTKSISAVDVDIFVNAVNSDSYIDEMEDIVHKLRMSSDASNIFPSTHHAFIRTYLVNGEPNELMRILNDRLNYGIFPDSFCYILLMDYFIEKGDFKNAAKLATLQMLQEEFPKDLLKYLSLYSCYKYLLNPTDWDEQMENSTEEDDGEEVKVRVKYLRNPFFDNHFDLRDPNSLIGKTVIMIAENIDSTIVKDLMLLGYILLKDWSNAKLCINDALKNKQSVTSITFDVVESIANNEVNTENETFLEVKNGLKLLKNENLVANTNLLQFLESKIKEEMPSGEILSQEQIKLYEEWDNNRNTTLRDEFEQLNKTNKLELIKKKKEELSFREQELFFFDHEDEIDLAIESKKVRYPRKWHGKKKKKKDVVAEYIPPEVNRSSS